VWHSGLHVRALDAGIGEGDAPPVMIRTLQAMTIFAASTALVLGGCGGRRARGGDAQQPAQAKVEPASKTPLPGGQEGASENQRTADLDNDGRPEVIKYYKMGADPAKPGEQKPLLVRQDIDLTWDGRIDIWRYFSDKGLVEKEEWDTDYDGKVDEIRYFEDGTIVRSERDRNNDGRFDIVRHYKNGKLERKESDTNDDGRVDRWEYYTGNVLDRVGVDKDRDGSVDTWAKQPGSAAAGGT
jgi:hypothetical protein